MSFLPSAAARVQRISSWGSTEDNKLAETPTTGTGQTDNKPQAKSLAELPDFDSMRLRIESLELEKKFLFEENSSLKEFKNQVSLNLWSLALKCHHCN